MTVNGSRARRAEAQTLADFIREDTGTHLG
jgi:hypothetical protein